MTNPKYTCPMNGEGHDHFFATDDLGLFIEHISTIGREELRDALIVPVDKVFSY